MAKFPSLPLFVDAYIADTTHLTDAEHGRYLLLLMHMWISPACRFPNDDKWLARKFKRTVEDVQSNLRPLIAEFMETDGNWITQKRLAKERKFVTIAHEKRSAAAKVRWDKEKPASNAYAPTPTPKQVSKSYSGSESEEPDRGIKMPLNWTSPELTVEGLKPSPQLAAVVQEQNTKRGIFRANGVAAATALPTGAPPLPPNGKLINQLTAAEIMAARKKGATNGSVGEAAVA